MSSNNDKKDFYPDAQKMSESHEVDDESSDLIVQETATKVVTNKRKSRDSKLENKPLLKDDAVGSTERIDLKTTSKKSTNKVGVQRVPT